MNPIENIKPKLIIDTDVGIDDAECLTFLAATKKFDILAITLVSGNASMSVISENMCRIRSVLGIDRIPIYKGSSFNLQGEFVESDGYFGENAFANISLPVTDKITNMDMCSAAALVHYVQKFPNQVAILCIGPLTNLAMAFLMCNDFPSLVESIHVVGTDSNEKTIKHPTTYSEFNAGCDPLSYKLISRSFQSKLKQPIQIIDWGLCWSHLIGFTLFKKLNSTSVSNKFIDLFKTITNPENPILKQNHWDNGFLTGDLMMGVGLYDPDVFLEKRRVSLDIDVYGDTPGHVIYKDDPNGIFVLITKVDIKRIEDDIVNILLNA